MALGHFHHLVGDPGVVGFHQRHVGHLVFAMGIKTGGDENHLGPKRIQRRQPALGHQLAHHVAPRAGGHRHIDAVGRHFGHRRGAAIRIEGVLEKADHQHPRIVGKHFLGAITVMDIEVDNGYPLQAMHFHRMTGSDGHIVEEAKAHRLGRSCMMARWTDRAEGIVDFAGQDGVGRRHGGTRGGPTRCRKMRVVVSSLARTECCVVGAPC